MNKRRLRPRAAVRLGLLLSVAVAAWAAPGTAGPYRGDQEMQLTRALDSLAVRNGIGRDGFRVDPAALDFARSFPGEFKLQRYLIREPQRIPGTLSAIGDDLVGGAGLAPRIAVLSGLAQGEEPRSPRSPALGAQETQDVLDASQPLIVALAKVFEGTGKRFQGKDRDQAVREVRTLPVPLQVDVARLLLGVLEAAKTRDRVVKESDLDRGGVFDMKSKKTADRLRSYLLQWDGEEAGFDPEQRKVWSALPTVDLGGLFDGGEDLARTVDAAATGLAGHAQGVDPGHSEFQYTWSTPLGAVSVGGTGANTYDGEQALVVDLGGDDSYLGPGGVSGRDPVSLVVDLGGDDRYAAADSGQAGPGGAILGYAGILDMGAGRDTYQGVSWACGFAFLGVGWIADGGGDDVYDTQWLGQGAALFGLALVLDAGGDDVFTVTAADSVFPAGRSQGFGGPGGVGALVDLAGSDTYRVDEATARMQGVARYVGYQQGAAGGFRDLNAGGIGLLVDGAGNDRYTAKDLAQGTGTDAGVGALIDRGGSDRYDGWLWVQGTGGRRGVGVLLETDGNDAYTVRGGRGLGAGNDLGTGMIVDFSGGDHYAINGLGFGSSQDQGAGWFLDLGGEDTYGSFKTPFARSVSGPGSPWRATVPGVAVFIDLEQVVPAASSAAPATRWFPAGGHGARRGGGVFGLVRIEERHASDGGSQ